MRLNGQSTLARIEIRSADVQPLSDTLVVDFTRYLPGAYASRELGRLGARVVRVEPPGGDPMRPTATAWDTALRAGSESVVCDLPVDAAFAQALCARADVVLESFRPGVAARLGIGPDDVPDNDGLLLDHRLRRRHDSSPPRRPRHQLPRMVGRPRGHGTRAPADPDRRSRRRRARCGDADPRRSPRARPHGDRAARRRLHDPPLARPGCASPRRRARASPPDRWPRVLPDLRDRGRAPPHRRRTRAEVLPPSL